MSHLYIYIYVSKLSAYFSSINFILNNQDILILISINYVASVCMCVSVSVVKKLASTVVYRISAHYHISAHPVHFLYNVHAHFPGRCKIARMNR